MTPMVSATIDTAALKHNLQRIRDFAPRSRVMAVIKANAYGHGLVAVARALDQADRRRQRAVHHRRRAARGTPRRRRRGPSE